VRVGIVRNNVFEVIPYHTGRPTSPKKFAEILKKEAPKQFEFQPRKLSLFFGN